MYKFIIEYKHNAKKLGNEIYAETWEKAEEILNPKYALEIYYKLKLLQK